MLSCLGRKQAVWPLFDFILRSLARARALSDQKCDCPTATTTHTASHSLAPPFLSATPSSVIHPHNTTPLPPAPRCCWHPRGCNSLCHTASPPPRTPSQNIPQNNNTPATAVCPLQLCAPFRPSFCGGLAAEATTAPALRRSPSLRLLALSSSSRNQPSQAHKANPPHQPLFLPPHARFLLSVRATITKNAPPPPRSAPYCQSLLRCAAFLRAFVSRRCPSCALLSLLCLLLLLPSRPQSLFLLL